MSASAPSARRRPLDRLLDRVERLGNRLPDPLVLFAGLFLLTAVLTTVLLVFYGLDLPSDPANDIHL